MSDQRRELLSEAGWAEWEAEQKAAERPAKESTVKLVIPDAEEIRLARPIPQKEIDEVNVRHRSLAQAVLTTALEIGCKLRGWHSLIPHGQWLKWCAVKLPNISERSIQVYLKLWNHSDLIKAHLKTAAAADLNEIPTIREALGWIPAKRSGSPVKEKRASRPHQLDIKATVKVCSAENSSDGNRADPTGEGERTASGTFTPRDPH